MKYLFRPAVAIAGLLSFSSFSLANDINGKWDSDTFDFESVIPLHSTLTPDGKIFGFGAKPGGAQQADKYVMWDPTKGTGGAAFESFAKPENVSNLFCTAQIIVPETGKLMAMGGQIGVDKHRTFQFDLDSLEIEETAPMELSADGPDNVPANQTGRYYATTLAMPDGKILIIGGSISGPSGPAGVATPELYNPATNTWKTLTATTAVGEIMMADKKGSVEKQRWWYPRAWVAPNGRVFGLAADKMFWLDVDGNGFMEDAGDFNGANWGATSTAVMYAPGKIIQVGGGTYANTNPDAPAGSKLATLIDITSGTPVVTNTAPMNFGRHWANIAVLPNGKVLVTGGAEGNNTMVKVAKKPELWDPATGQWTLLDTEEKLTRQYHSVSLLLPDGRIMSGGGGAPGPGGLNSPNAQIFNPPYLFNGTTLAPRPSWSSVPAAINYGSNFNATVGAGQTIDRVTLIKNGSATHSFNFEQRFIELDFTQSGNMLTITGPATSNIATPGYYMLFALNAAGTPSVAKIVKVEQGSGVVDPQLVNPGAQTTTVNTPVSLTLAASDPDGGAVTFSATGLPTGLVLNQATGKITGTPTLIQTKTVVITVTDDEGATASTTFLWTIKTPTQSGEAIGHWPFDSNFNDAAGDNDAVGAGGASLVSDPERGSVLECDGTDDVLTIGNTLTANFSFSLWIKTSAASIAGTKAWQGNGLLWSDVGGSADDFVISALNNSIAFWDGDGNFSTNMTTTINNGQWHHIAVTRAAGGAATIYLDGALSTTGAAGTAALTANPSIKICANTLDGKFFGGLVDELKLFDTVLTAQQVADLAADEVGSNNTPPVLANPGAQTSTQNSPVSLALSASDADNDVLSFAATGLPTGLVIGASNGIISGSPSVAGNFLITVTVSDSQGVSDSVTFTWVVDAQTGGNTLGIVNPGTPVSAVGEPVTLAIDAGNVENLTFFATAMPPGITFNATTGVFSGAPTASGAFEVVIVAQTAFDNRDVDTFTWQIFGADESGPSIDALSYWPLDNHFGDVLGTNDAQPAGSLALVTDAERGKVLACTGSATDYLQITNTLTPDFSMAFWMKTSATSFTGGAAWAGSGIVWSDISGAADDMVIAHLNNSIGFWDGDGPNKANATQSLSDNTWHHIVVTREAGVASKIFIDGTLAVTSGAGVAALTANPIMHICANTLNSKAFDGLLDDLLLFDRVLNPSEVTALANDAITIGSGGGSASTTVAVTGTTVWNVNPDNNSVSATNVTTQVATQVAVGSAPWSLAISPVANELWVVNKGSASISVINLATKVMTRTITLPKSSQPHGIVFGSDGFAYVALEATGKVQKINAQTDAVVSTLSLVGRVRHLSITADGATLYASRFVSAPVPGESGAAPNTDLAKAEIYKIATGSLALVDVLTLGHNDVAIGEVTGPGLPNYLNAPVISPDGSSLWIPSKQDNIGGGQLRGTPLSFDQAVRATTTAISLGSGQSIATIDHDNSSVATGAVFSADGQYLFVALETSREVAVVDVSAGVEILRINVGRAPQGLMLNTAQTQLYVHNFMDRSLSIVDVANLLAGTSFNVGDIDTVSLVASEALPPAVFTGKQLFYDAMDDRLAEDNYMSCASCHNEGDDDGRVWDFTQFGEGVRNTINLRGKAGTGHGPLHWTGNFDEVQDFEGQIRALAGGIGLLNGSVNSPLAAPNANLSADLDALSAYVSSLSKVDPSPARKANGDLTTKAEAGKTLFANKNCGSCHSGSNFTDSALDVFHNIGTLTPASGNRLSATLPGLDTPSLLGVWATAPYLHDGSATSLEAAIMAHDGLGIGLVPLSQLAAFLNQLDANEQ